MIQKKKFSIKNFFSKCDQYRSFLGIWSHLLKKLLMENFIFYAVTCLKKSQCCAIDQLIKQYYVLQENYIWYLFHIFYLPPIDCLLLTKLPKKDCQRNSKY